MYQFPDKNILTEHLVKLFSNGREVHVEVLSRKFSMFSSTFPSEIIECREGQSKPVMLLCKHLAARTHNSFGHRGGIEYEAKIYEQVLRHIPLSSTRYYGLIKDETQTGTWMVIEYLENSQLIKDTRGPEAFKKAAAWIARFHAWFESHMPACVKPYDLDYYLQWVKRIENSGNHLYEKYPWLQRLCAYYSAKVELLLEAPQTLVHGEYYPKNILISNGIIYPVDWESAAYGPGEIDLASLIEGWDDKRVTGAVESYLSVRWPDGAFSIDVFHRRLLISKLYFLLRWIGEDPGAGIWLKNSKLFQRLEQLAAEAGCV